MASTKVYLAAGVAAAIAAIALQWNKIETQKTELTTLESRLDLASQTNRQQQAAIKELEDRDAAMASEISQLVRETRQSAPRKTPAAPPTAAATPAGAVSEAKSSGGLLEDMMKDPDMVKAIAQQQATLLKTQYAPLLKQLNLTPDQRDAFYKLLTDELTNNMAQSVAMFSGTNKPDAASAMASSQTNMQNQMKSLLGDSGYAQYQEFQTTLTDRQLLDQMKPSFADTPLTDDQQQQLLQLMVNERKNTTPAIDPNTGQPAVATSNNAAALDQAVQYQEQINQRVYQQAAAFLSAAQLDSLGASQTNFINLTKASMTMVQKMMGTNVINQADGP